MNRIRLLITSEEPSSRRSLKAIFDCENVFELLGDSSIEDIVDKSIIFQPDIILFDIIKDISKHGQFINKLKKECPYTMIVVLVDNEHPNNFSEVLSLGIDGCLPRSIIRGCLVKTVELVCQTGLFCLPGHFKKKILLNIQNNVISLDMQKNNSLSSGEHLTKRELEILQLMAENYSNRDIASKLFISELTVKTHVSNILRKLGQSNRSQAIVYAYRVGLVKDAQAAAD